MIRRILLIAFGALVAAAPCVAAGYSYVTADQLKERLAAGSSTTVIVDLQPADEFRERHFNDSVWIGPLPGKARAALKKLDRIARKQLRSRADIVIVSCTGAADAEQALERLSGHGIARKRLLILEHGMDAAARGVGCDCCRIKDDNGQQPQPGNTQENTTTR